MQRSSPRPGRRAYPRAFTLIELLTVIAIIGILAAILIPTVGKVRTKAREAQKTSNYRQIWIAAAAYATDNKDTVVPTQGPDPDRDGWRKLLAPYVSANGATDSDYNRLPIYVDPLFEEYSAANPGVSGVSMNEALGTPEDLQSVNRVYAAKYKKFLLSQITYPERRVFIVDSNIGPFINLTQDKLDAIVATRHGGGSKGMAVRFNGSVVLLGLAALKQGVTDPSRDSATP